MILDFGDARAATVAAMRFTAPAVVFAILASSFLIRELLEKLVEADRLWLVLFVAHET